jgi:hypothetical protein
MNGGDVIRHLTNGFCALTRVLVIGLPFFLLLQLVSQPELDDRHPVIGVRSHGVKIAKLEQLAKSGLSQPQQFFLTFENQLFASQINLSFIHLPRRYEFVQARPMSFGSNRSPPLTASF